MDSKRAQMDFEECHPWHPLAINTSLHFEDQAGCVNASQSLFGRAKRKAEKIPVLRILVSSRGGFGVENCAFDTLRCWFDVSQSSRIEMIVGKHQANQISLLAPGYDCEKKHQEVKVFGRSVCFISEEETHKLEPLPFGLLPGCCPFISARACCENINVKSLVCIQPFRWEPESDGWFEGDSSQKIPLATENLHLHPLGNAVVDDKELDSVLRSFVEKNKLSIEAYFNIVSLIVNAREHNINLSTIYGLHAEPKNAQDIIFCLANSCRRISTKRTVLLILSELEGYIAECSERCSGLKQVNIKRMNQPLHWSEDAELDKTDVDVVFCGNLPKPIFERFVELSNLPVFLEGANTYQLVQSKGKTHLSVAPYRYAFPIFLEQFPDASEKMLHVSTCLGFQYFLLREMSQAWIDNIEKNAPLKKTFLLFLEEAETNHSFFSSFSKFINNFTEDSRVINIFFGMVSLFYSFDDSKRSRLYLIDKFFRSRSENIEYDDERQLLIKLIEDNLIVDFALFIEEETISSLCDYISSSLDDNSEISRMSKYLQEMANNPENNKLFHFLDKIPDELLTV